MHLPHKQALGCSVCCCHPASAWLPSAAFCQAIPVEQPQLRRLVLTRVAPISHACAAALAMMCGDLHRAGRPFELVFQDPQGGKDGLHEVVALLQGLQPLVRVSTV